MAFLGEIPLIGGTLAVAVPFLIVLSIVVFVHEFGHYVVGRWCGIHAEIFSIGFGTPLVGWTDRRGTRWQVAALPLGGYVKFVGDMDPASAGSRGDDELTPEQRRHAFHHASLRARAATVVAGPAANFLLSILLFAGVYMATGMPSDAPVIGRLTDAAAQASGFVPGDRVVALDGQPVASFGEMMAALNQASGPQVAVTLDRGPDRVALALQVARPPRVAEVPGDGAAAAAGVRPGDLVRAIDGQPVASTRDVQMISLAAKPGAPLTLEVLRDGAPLAITLVPVLMERDHPVTGVRGPLPTMGISFQPALSGIERARDPVGPLAALALGADRVWAIVATTVGYLYSMIFDGGDTSQLGGPIHIAKVSGQEAAKGLSDFTWLIAVLSTSIGLLNLFPIPVLDGGHLMFYAVEAVRGRPVGGAAIRVGTAIGLSLVLLLMVFATYNDVVRVFSTA